MGTRTGAIHKTAALHGEAVDPGALARESTAVNGFTAE
jgi:hypothetical protein